MELDSSLPELRSVLGDAVTIADDPCGCSWPPTSRSDDAAGGTLLDGVGGSPAFEKWLRVMRRGSRATPRPSCTRPRWLSSRLGVPPKPLSTLRRLVASDPFDEAHHELLVRSLAAAGDRAGALAQVTACRRLFREQLGTEPSPAVRNAAGPDAPVEPTSAAARRAAGSCEAGEAAMASGALEYGLSCLRRACMEAAISGDVALGARSLTALGTALVHAVRGRDEEGAAVLHQALAGGPERGRSRIAGRRAAGARVHRHPGRPRAASRRGSHARRNWPRATRNTRRS